MLKKELTEDDARMLLGPLSFPLNKMKLAKSDNQLLEYADEIGYPVALKVVSPQIIHKSDVGGVKVGIKNKEELAKILRFAVKELLAIAVLLRPFYLKLVIKLFNIFPVKKLLGRDLFFQE